MRVIIVSIFLLNLLTAFHVGLVMQVKLAERSIKQEREKLALIEQQKEEEQKLIDFKRFPNLRIGEFTKSQTRLLATAYEIGRSYDRETREVVQGLLLQESAAGTVEKIGGLHLPVALRYYGVMQLKVAAVQDVLRGRIDLTKTFFGKEYDEIEPEEIIAKLLTDDRFSLRVAYAYYAKYRKQCKDVYVAITLYNQGPLGVRRVENPEEFNYTANVVRHIKYNVKPFNKKLEQRFNLDQS